MNLKDFLDYRINCPVCDEKLTTSFHSRKKQSLKLLDNRLVVIFQMTGLKKGQADYKVGYSFGFDDNSWYAEFYNWDETIYYEQTPDFLRTRFREMDRNLGSYKFYRHCTQCNRYNYSSNDFGLNYQKSCISNLKVNVEYIGMLHKTPEGFKVYKLTNYYNLDTSTILFGNHDSDIIARSDAGAINNGLSLYKPPYKLDMIQLPIVKFESHEETMNRVKNLIIFS